MDIAERARLEAGFAREISRVIEGVAYSGMSDENLSVFENALTTFLKYEDIKEFVLDSLFEKAKEVARAIKPDDKERFFSFRKVIRLVLKFGDQDSINIFSTFLLSDKLPFHFFVMLEEMVARGMEYKEAEKAFLSLISVQKYNREMVERYLEIIGKDVSYLTERLLQSSIYISMRHFIGIASAEQLRYHVVPSIMKHYTGDRTHYLGLVSDIMQLSQEFSPTLLNRHEHVGSCEEAYSKYIIGSMWHNIPVVKNFAIYLQEHNPKAWPVFEDKYIAQAGGGLLVRYAEEVPNTNKRKVLIRLVELKNEPVVVEFIKKFPAFSSLLPML